MLTRRHTLSLLVLAALAGIGTGRVVAQTRASWAPSGGTSITAGSGLTLDGGSLSLTAPMSAQVLAVDDATNNSTTALMTLRHTTSGTASAGIGALQLFQTEDGSGNTQDTADITGALSVVTNSSELGYLRLRAMNGAAGTAAMGDGAYVWGNGRLGIGTSTTAPRGQIDVIGSGAIPIFVGDVNAAAGGYPIFQAYRQGTLRGYWGINSTDELVNVAGATQFRVSNTTGVTMNTVLGINQATLAAAVLEVTPLGGYPLFKLGSVFDVTSAGVTTIASDVKLAGIIWNTTAGNETTTVGSSGGATAPPAQPVKYLTVKLSDGNPYKIPVYNP